MITIRKTELKDLDDVMGIYEHGRQIMRNSGNLFQWQNDRPYREQIIDDIEKGNSYVAENREGLCGVFALIFGEDVTYGYIEGSWLNDEPYGTIHRIATSGREKGVLEAAVNYGFSQIDNIRIDTHHDNKIMQHLLKKLGFTECGVIYLLDGDPRLAYQKTKKQAY